MNNSSLRIFLLLVFFTSFTIIGFTLDGVFDDEKEITSQSFSFENTTIIEFTNNSLEELKTVRIWLTDSSFKSLKSENGWTSTIAPQEVIIFITSEPIKTNETVKFGIKTDKPNPLIHWEALDKEENQIEIGKTQSQTIQAFVSTQEQRSIKDLTGILSESTFKIPKKTKAEQVNFVLKDKQENEKIISLQLTEIEQKIPKNIGLTVSETKNEFYRTDRLEFSGTAKPNVPIIIKIKNPQGSLFSTKIENADSQGHWSTSIYIPRNTPIGKYSTEITDGKNTIIESWDVVMSKKIHIFPTKLTFKSEELIKFNGTANPGERINIKFVDPQGNEVLSKNFIVNTSGFFEIEYPTISTSSEGTYILYAFQEHETEIVFAGLGEYPKNILSAKLNNVNYHSEDVAIIGITGEDSQDLKLLIIDQNGNEKFSDKIGLGPDGKRNYELNLTKFPTGVYTLLVSMASFQTSEVFTVGLQSSSMPIDLEMIKKSYNPGQSILVTGKSKPNTIVNFFLIDPDGIIINEKESFVNKNGGLSMNDFIIPYNVTSGKWIVRAESGSNFANFEFQVSPSEKEGLSVRVTDILSSSIGKFVTIEGFGTVEQTVKITIEDPRGYTVFHTNVRTTESGEFDLLWKVQSEYVSGTYSVIVKDSFEKTTTTIFDL
ncbi:MAG: hypothetical protein IH792_05340 [Thaumarchaeota archaeon]|nr:hypothetical protein [Nitrososphaerota archaeon]